MSKFKIGILTILVVLSGRGNCNEEQDENMEELLEWRIFPTAAEKVPQPVDPTRAERKERGEPQDPVSRDELVRELLKDERREIHVEDFLWTGSGDGELPETDYIDTGNNDLENRLDVQIMPTTLTVTQVSTLYVAHPTLQSDLGNANLPHPPGVIPTQILPTPSLPSTTFSSTLDNWDTGISPSRPYVSPEVSPINKLPKDEFIVRTILHSNMTIIHNKVEDFKHAMEQKLTRAYRRAYEKNQLNSRWMRKRRSIPEEIMFRHGRLKRSAIENKPQKLLKIDDDQEEEESKSSLRGRSLRDKRHRTPPRVMIHNIRSALPEPKIEVLYTVYQDDEPIPAEIAAEALQDIEDSDVEVILGYPLEIKAEPYTQEIIGQSAQVAETQYLMGALIVSAFVIILVVVALVFLLHRAKRAGLSLKHSRLLGSPDHTTMESSHAQTSTPGGSMDRVAFTLDRPQSGKAGLVRVLASPKDSSNKSTPLQPPSTENNGKMSRAQTRSSINAEGEKGALSRSSSRAAATAGGESPSMADMSSNQESPHSPQKQPRAKKGGGKRKSRNRNLLTPPNQGYSSGAEQSQSAFPVPTPDRLGPLTDLLEEDGEIPGESRGNSGRRRQDWAFLPRPKTPGSTSSSESYVEEGTQMSNSPWQEEVAKTREMAKKYRKVLDETFGTQVEVIEDIEATDKAAGDAGEPDDQEGGQDGGPSSSMKKRAVSAKSHIFRKGKIENKLAKMGRNRKTRPWSAHESRLQADPIFHMRKKHWEGLIAGKKRLHRGKLIEGSTSSTASEDDRDLKKTCWSECSSPRKQVRLDVRQASGAEPPTHEISTPLIKAIKEELHKFQRPKSPNLAGISIINDPDLLMEEEKH